MNIRLNLFYVAQCFPVLQKATLIRLIELLYTVLVDHYYPNAISNPVLCVHRLCINTAWNGFP